MKTDQTNTKEPTSPINPKAQEKEAIKDFVNEGNPATVNAEIKNVSTATVLEHLSNPKI